MTDELLGALRAMSDDELGALLRLRPDLLAPAPSDLAALAARATSRVSVARALDPLNQFTLQVLDAVRLERSDALPPSPGVRAALARLRARCLIFGAESAPQAAPAISELCGPYPAGLGRPASQLGSAAADLVTDAAKLRRTLLSAPPDARAVLDRLAAGPPIGSSNGGNDTLSWLLEQHLLVQVEPNLVELPREVGVLLRRDTGPLGELQPDPPKLTGTAVAESAADRAGAGQVLNLLRHTEDLLEALAADPQPALRGGGLGVLPLRRLAKSAGVSEPDAALLLEVTHAAGLLGESDEVFRPAAGYDGWRRASLAQRWILLAEAWLALPRRPALAGQRDDKDRPLTVFSPELERSGMPAVRRMLLGALAGAGNRLAPDPDALFDLLRWQAPRRLRGQEEIYQEILREAGVLGFLGAGALTTFGKPLLTPGTGGENDPLGLRPDAARDPGETPAARALAAVLPAPVDHMLIQADLTIVVPGPATPDLAAELTMVADHESGGGADVYRVTASSVRRALDAGYAGDDLHKLFRSRSRTPVPQALTYLVDDTSRTHGGLRVGTAAAYLRSEDQALISAALADNNLADLRLRRLAPTVLVTPYPSGRLTERLREAGYAAVGEDAAGAVVQVTPKVRRAPARPALRPHPTEPPSAPHVLGVVADLRRREARVSMARDAPDELRAAAGRPMSSATAVHAHSQALVVLQQAVRQHNRVWVGYVDAHGAAVSRLMRPVSIGSGYLRAEDERTQMLHTLALHRVTAAALAD